MIDEGGILEILVIRRLRCKEPICRKIHHELPDCLYPYKRHCAETIEKIIADEVETTPCTIDEAAGIKKWWNTMHPYFVRVLLSLNTKHGTCFDPGTPPRKIVRAVVNSHLWVHTHSLVTPTGRVDTIIPKPAPRCFSEEATGA